MRKTEKNTMEIERLLSIVSNILTIISWLGITSISVVFVFFQHNFWLIVPFAVLILLLIVLYIFRKQHDNLIKWFLKLFAYNTQYYFEEWTARYEFKSEYKMSFYTSYVVRALQSGVDHIKVRFNWTGSTDTNPITPTPICDSDFHSMRLEWYQKEYGYNYYKLFSRNKINKNDKPIKLGVKIENLDDKYKKASPHLLTSISVVTKKLNMIVVLPTTIYPERIRCLEYLHSTDDVHWHDLSDQHTLVRDSESKHWILSWTVNKPVFGGKYIMSWEPEIEKTS